MPVELLDTNPKTHIYHQLPIVDKLGTNRNNDLLIMIPGNPGLIEFYITYLDLIQQELPSFEILCIAHAGFLGNDDEPQESFDLKFQIEHKYQIIKEFIFKRYNQNQKQVQLYVLTHSMGSFVFQRSLKKLLQDQELKDKFQVKFTGFITPTILDIANSDLGKKVAKAMEFNIPIIPILLFFRVLILLIFGEQQLKKMLGNHLSKQNKDIIGLENSVIGSYKILQSKAVIRQALIMAQEEMHVIDLDESINDWYFQDSTNGFKRWVFFAQDDHWVGNHTRERIIEKYGNDGSEKNENVMIEICRDLDNPIAHSFCVCQSKEFAEITVDRIVGLCGLNNGKKSIE